MRKLLSPRPMARRLVAGAAALLFALQALALVGAAAARASGAFGAGVSATRCVGASDDAPITRHGAEDHCLQCASRETPGPAAVEPSKTRVFVPFGVRWSIWSRDADSARAPPLGWASSWSSRAPPFPS
ncbi:MULTISPECIES: hypothetical protein [Methylosinus]|uniref:DUF2946 domain-containing protein n=1 Tax=Methylosinus trichosporium (strain ATCC 35070 / NCIMB 11131 / UNIQEM 75 / OB3b) TaxID=595536 RepID=A0A2D2CVJ5_METT3|nr:MULTISPECIES: hypothetical protein [Methylosinus]ATQ66822.1 hypothetical protein CQW49_02115 [Methylosinus trichosporium OB3b]OBS50639.1 hypothetical protein A8B73_20600 [Methylosinus sp. 3S-1]